MIINKKRNVGRTAVSVFTALLLTCTVAACGFKGTGSTGSAGAGSGTGTGSGSVNAGIETGSGNGTAAIPQDSILNFDNDAGFARLQADMAAGDVPVECNVLYDVMGERPDVTVKDEEMIREIYERLSQVKVGEKSMTGVTDSYHHVTFHLRNDTFVSFYFEGESLFCWGYDNYYVAGGEPLWSYVRQLQEMAMESNRQKADAKVGVGSTAGTAAASAAGQAGDRQTGNTKKDNKKDSSDDSARTVLDGKNPTADTGKNGGKDSGKTALTGGVSSGNAEDLEITGRQDAGELTQEASGVEGSGLKVSNAEVIPGNGQHADALQGTIPGAAQNNSAQGTGQNNAQNTDRNAGQDPAQNAQPEGNQPREPQAEGTQSEEPQAEETQPEVPQPEGTEPEEPQSEGTEPGEPQPEGTEPGETQPGETQPEGIQPEEPQPEGAQSGETQIEGIQPGSGQEDPLQAERTAAMNSAYTEIVRAHAAVLAMDRTKFLQDYENGVYNVGITTGQAGSDDGTDLSGINTGEDVSAGVIEDPETGEEPQAGAEPLAEEPEPQTGAAAAPEEAGIAGQNPAADSAGTEMAAASGADPRINYEMFREYFANPEGSDVFYGLRDYNEDGTPELVIALGTAEFRHIWAGYTFDGQKAVPLFTGRYSLGYRVDLYTLSDKSFMIHGSGGATAGRDTIARIAAGGTGLEILGEYEYDEQTNGTMDHFGAAETLSDEEFQERFWADAKPAAENVSFHAVRTDVVVQ